MALMEEHFFCPLKLLGRRWANLAPEVVSEIKQLAHPPPLQPHPLAVIFEQALYKGGYGHTCLIMRKRGNIDQERGVYFVTQTHVTFKDGEVEFERIRPVAVPRRAVVDCFGTSRDHHFVWGRFQNRILSYNPKVVMFRQFEVRFKDEVEFEYRRWRPRNIRPIQRAYTKRAHGIKEAIMLLGNWVINADTGRVARI